MFHSGRYFFFWTATAVKTGLSGLYGDRPHTHVPPGTQLQTELTGRRDALNRTERNMRAAVQLQCNVCGRFELLHNMRQREAIKGVG